MPQSAGCGAELLSELDPPLPVSVLWTGLPPPPKALHKIEDVSFKSQGQSQSRGTVLTFMGVRLSPWEASPPRPTELEVTGWGLGISHREVLRTPNWA